MVKPPAITAYNFVPFTRTVLPSPLNEKKEDFKGYLNSQKTYSGMIQLQIHNLTPLFIGDGDAEEEFFSPDGSPIIPGSSLRGMTRNLFKIVTAGTMRRDEDFTDRHLYFRCLMAPNKSQELKELHAYYVNRMQTEDKDSKDKKPVKKAKPGFLYHSTKDGRYYMAPCDMKSILFSDYGTVPPKPQVVWNDREKIAYIFTGNQEEKKYVRCLFHPDWNQAQAVPDALIQEYRDDTRRRGVNLLDTQSSGKQRAARINNEVRAFTKQKNIDFLVPCFYTKEDGQITSFGHGRSYRIPYHHSISDRLPEVLQSAEDVVDFADAVFGYKEHWAGRVSFEDAHLNGPADFDRKDWVKPLLGANPTSFQLYLTQQDWPPAHWDSDAPVELRGYKMYWHKHIGNDDWRAADSQQNYKITKKIRPLRAGHTFTSAIHFRNLTAIELGALLKVFHLQDGASEDIVYKLGMGKSLGMGSIRIQTTLQLDTDGRYQALFEKGKWKTSSTETEAQPFIQAFDTYAGDHLGQAKKSYQASLKALRIMLDWKNTQQPGWNQRVRDVGSENAKLFKNRNNQFMKRDILPTPDKVVKK